MATFSVPNINPPVKSKINWTQIVSAGASALTVFGLDISPETKVAAVAGIGFANNVVTWLWRTWFTGR